MMLRSGLYKLTIICHLMSSPLSQNMITCAWTSNRESGSQNFLRHSSQVIILKSGLSKNFHQFLRSIDYNFLSTLGCQIYIAETMGKHWVTEGRLEATGQFLYSFCFENFLQFYQVIWWKFTYFHLFWYIRGCVKYPVCA